MTLKAYLVTMMIITLVCWLGWFYILLSINPETTNGLGFGLFYLSLSLALIGTCTVIGFFIRFVALKNDLIFRSVKDAFRQSFLISFLVIAALVLLSEHLFSWLNLLLLIGGLSMLEYFLISYRKSNN